MSKSAIEILSQVKDAIREPYAWPGGYPKYIVMVDGESLSINAAKEHWRLIREDTLSGSGTWQAAGVDINWEDGSLYCCHSGDRIESAYAEDGDS